MKQQLALLFHFPPQWYSFHSPHWGLKTENFPISDLHQGQETHNLGFLILPSAYLPSRYAAHKETSSLFGDCPFAWSIL